MEIIGTILMALLVALLLGTAITFGFTLILIIVCTAFVMATLMVIQEAWRRWRFVKSATDQPPQGASGFIEGEYQDVTHKEDL